MKKVLDPLMAIPGVRRAMLFSPEGVPIVTIQTARKSSSGDGEMHQWIDSAEDETAFAGLAAGWLHEVCRTVDPLSWEAPTRIVLQASRGTLILLLLDRAVLSVELERGAAPEEVRLPMEAAEARFNRLLRRKGSGEKSAAKSNSEQPQGIFPGGEGTPAVDGQGMNDETRNEVPEATRDC